MSPQGTHVEQYCNLCCLLHCVWSPSVLLLLYTQVINWSGRPDDNGVDYPVKKGCSKYAFTVEQIEQKKEKKTRMVNVFVCLCLCMCVGGGDVCMCVCVFVCVSVCSV